MYGGREWDEWVAVAVLKGAKRAEARDLRSTCSTDTPPLPTRHPLSVCL